MKLSSSTILLLEIGLNRALALDPETARRLRLLAGKVIGIEIKGVGLTFFLSPQQDGLQILSDYDGEVHSWIRGGPFALLRTALGSDRSAIYSGEVKIEGDLDIGERVQRLLKNVQIDWEEPIAKVFGDAIGHRIGEAIRGTASWLKQAAGTVTLDTAEYLKEESRDLVSRYEHDQFCRGVDQLRADLDRLEQRIERLQIPRAKS